MLTEFYLFGRKFAVEKRWSQEVEGRQVRYINARDQRDLTCQLIIDEGSAAGLDWVKEEYKPLTHEQARKIKEIAMKTFGPGVRCGNEGFYEAIDSLVSEES